MDAVAPPQSQSPSAPHGAEVRQEDPAQRPITLERRNGAVLGMSAGVGFAGASGFPNDAKFQGNPAFFSESPLLVGWSTSYFLMGALTDYLSFGPMLNIATFESEKWKSTGFGLGFRGEVFPLLGLAKMWNIDFLADTAAYAQFGFGTTEPSEPGSGAWPARAASCCALPGW